MSIQQEFLGFHKANPHVYEEICKLARQWVAVGKTQLGIGMIFEVIRWNTAISTSNKDYKLNNNYRSRYVRLIEEQEDDLQNVFATRKLSSTTSKTRVEPTGNPTMDALSQAYSGRTFKVVGAGSGLDNGTVHTIGSCTRKETSSGDPVFEIEGSEYLGVTLAWLQNPLILKEVK